MKDAETLTIIVYAQHWIIWGLLCLNYLWIKKFNTLMEKPLGVWPYLKGILIGMISGPFGIVVANIIKRKPKKELIN